MDIVRYVLDSNLSFEENQDFIRSMASKYGVIAYGFYRMKNTKGIIKIIHRG